MNDKKAVNAAFVRFTNLLYEFGLSVQKDEVLAVKLEVDTNPPIGAKLEPRSSGAMSRYACSTMIDHRSSLVSCMLFSIARM